MQVLEGVMLNRILAEEARQMGLDSSDEVKAALQQAADKILANRRMEKFEASIPIPDLTKAAREQYELNRSKYFVNEKVTARHILIATKERSDAEARPLAEEIRTRLLNGEEFEALAQKYSDDKGTKRTGGTLPEFQRGQMVKPFEDAAFALTTANELSPVIKTDFGYHVIRLDARHAEHQIPFESVEEKITTPLKSRIINEERARFLSKLRNDPSIKIHTDAIERLMGAASDPKAQQLPPSTNRAN
jgi:peptidyl-prolyl cis-trans isomerase C